ncbi:SFT2-like protein [Ancylostoma duodenale]|uniref:Vesicle transport protein n=1 Tax=Ancylostoma duodenale TaxID=51022 RepID=A0A0C2GJS6_9BILA|nr:SFT2-like protein [Ancylostoma duodenale]
MTLTSSSLDSKIGQRHRSIARKSLAGYLLLLTKLNGFCIMSSIGAILSLASTCFLMGPVGQCKKMFDKKPVVGLIILCGLHRTGTCRRFAGCRIAGLVLENAPLALVAIGGQYVAMAWYSLSYIPYARVQLHI